MAEMILFFWQLPKMVLEPNEFRSSEEKTV